MSDERKKSVWPWIAALLIGLPVLYVALFGPSFWLWTKMGQPRWMLTTLALAYDPILNSSEGWPIVRDYVNWWITLGAER
jgi:hypothetical protein